MSGPDWITMPETMLSEVMRLLDPIPDYRSSADLRDVRRKELAQRKGCTTDVPRTLIEGMVAYLVGSDLTCDHAVNICMCAEIAAHYELTLLLDGKLICAQCGGDGFVFDEASYEAEVRKYAQWAGVTEGEIRAERDDEAGQIPCPACDASGLTRVPR
jgi:hypothetical protein